MGGFEDLLPAEIAGSRRPGPAPMRPSTGSPPKAGGGSGSPPKPGGGMATAASTVAAATSPAAPATLPAGASCSVDGVPDSMVDAWFREADADSDGRVADSEARAFFLTSGLAPQDLSKIWQLVKSPEVIAREGKGLSRYRFAQMLRLIALAQSGGSAAFTPENTTAALSSARWLALHGTPLPPPRIGTAAQRAATASATAPAAPPAASDSSRSGNPFAGSGGGSGAAEPPAAPHQQHQQHQQPPAAASEDLLDVGGDDLLLGCLASSPAAAPTAAPAALSLAGPFSSNSAADGSYVEADDDLFGLKALQERAASHGAASSSEAAETAAVAGAAEEAGEGGDGLQRRLSRSTAVSSRRPVGGGAARVHTSALEPPVAFEARLPPLQPKVSAKLVLLAAGNGSLFAGPAVNGGLLQWGRPEGNLRRPLDVGGEHVRKGKLGRLMSDMMYTHTATESHAPTEDPDAAPALEVAVTDKARPVSCLLVDEAAALLWVADKEGWVYAYDVAGEPSMSLRATHRPYQFQVHRVGYVTAMCRTAQGELWTGSSRGNIRVWELGEPALAGDAPEPPRCRELRKSLGERAHSSPVLRLTCPADGQLVWSASTKGVILWDAACGAFLGVLQRCAGGGGGGGGGGGAPRLGAPPSQSDLLASGGIGGESMRHKVEGAAGLEIDPITGYVVARPPSSEWGRIAADQEAWAAQTDNNINELMERVSIGGSRVVQGAGKAVKLLGKLARGLGGGGASTAAEAPKQATGAGAASMRQANTYAALAAAAAAAEEDASQSAGDSSVGAIVEVLAPPDGSVWVAHKGGIVDRYTSAGRRVGSADCGASLTAAACVGRRVWLGFSDGMISVRDAACASLKVFQAHEAGLLSIVQAGSRTYSLAADGSLKGWNSAVPHPADMYALTSWDEQACATFRRESLRLLCVTWNVGESKPEGGSPFFRWVHEAAFNCQLAVVGLQEVEMGTSSVALAAAKDAFSQRMQERGNTNAKFWSAGVLGALGGERHWHQVGLRQLSGMLLMVFARNHLKEAIGEVTTASVACGVLGVGGNKGAVAVEFSVHRRKLAIVCSHFAAHQGAVEARNANYASVCRQLTFSRRAWFTDDPDALGGPGSGLPGSSKAGGRGGASPYSMAAVMEEGMGTAEDFDSDADSVGFTSVEHGFSSVSSVTGILAPSGPSASLPLAVTAEEVAGGEGMRGADVLVWLGDFNYRIDGAYEAVKEHAIRNELGPLLELDQCRREMAGGRVFRGLREGPLTFRPTYKFDKASANPFAYDTSEKRRIPAWCDRILFRGSVPFPTPEPVEGESVGVCDEEDDVSVMALDYNCWADVTDSDHKPVYAVLEANLPITDQAKKREVCSMLLKECAAAALRGGGEGQEGEETAAAAAAAAVAWGGEEDEEEGEEAPRCSLLPSHIKLHPTTIPTQLVLLRNEGPCPLLFSVSCQDNGTGGATSVGRHVSDDLAAVAAAHQLLEVRPVRGVVPPGEDAQLQVHLAGDEWLMRGVEHAPELTYTVRVGSEYSAGGDAVGPGCTQLSFTATCLTHL